VTEAMSAEFDTVAAWTASVARELGPEYHVPAGCRGSGSPAALEWLIEALELSAADRMLDCGAGVGGPAAFAADRVRVRPVLAEPEPGACRAARQLFGLPVVQADAAALPLRSGGFDVAWCLGVLCTTTDQAAVLAELRRVVSDHGRLGLLVFTATTTYLPVQPDGNNFPTLDGLRRLLSETGWRIETIAPPTVFRTEPASWRDKVAAIEAELERRHHDHPAWRLAQRQANLFGHLLATGQVESTLLVARST
jgi:ubiquinone/menaquinone biosynthesis C-methylase UbiE